MYFLKPNDNEIIVNSIEHFEEVYNKLLDDGYENKYDDCISDIINDLKSYSFDYINDYKQYGKIQVIYFILDKIIKQFVLLAKSYQYNELYENLYLYYKITLKEQFSILSYPIEKEDNQFLILINEEFIYVNSQHKPYYINDFQFQLFNKELKKLIRNEKITRILNENFNI